MVLKLSGLAAKNFALFVYAVLNDQQKDVYKRQVLMIGTARAQWLWQSNKIKAAIGGVGRHPAFLYEGRNSLKQRCV